VEGAFRTPAVVAGAALALLALIPWLAHARMRRVSDAA